VVKLVFVPRSLPDGSHATALNDADVIGVEVAEISGRQDVGIISRRLIARVYVLAAIPLVLFHDIRVMPEFGNYLHFVLLL
jgi:hypothetical protein